MVAVQGFGRPVAHKGPQYINDTSSPEARLGASLRTLRITPVGFPVDKSFPVAAPSVAE